MRYNCRMTKSKAKPTSKKNSKKSAPKSGVGELIAANTVVKLTIPWKQVDQNYQQALKELSKQVKAQGFRKGKAPAKMAEQVIGKAKLVEKTLDRVLPAVYRETITAQQKRPLTNPEFKPISLEEGKDWVIEAMIAEPPQFKLGKYQTTVEEANKNAQVEIKKVEKQQTKTKKNNKKETKQATTPQELTTEQKKEATLRIIFTKLVSTIKPQIPELLLRQETRRELNDLVNNLSHMSLKLDGYLQQRNLTFEQLSSELAAVALGRLQLDFILGAIAQEQKFVIPPQEIKLQIAKIKDKKVRQTVEKDGRYTSQLELTLVRQKVIDYLLSLK